MADITLGNLIALIFNELAESLEQTADRAEQLRLQVSDLQLDIPAHLRLQAGPLPEAGPAQLMVTLPSTRETPPAGRLGRVHIMIERYQPLAPEEPL